MKILVACENSAKVSNAFRKKGHIVISCDLLPSRSPRFHYQGDVKDILHMGFDMMIAHPPCIYICNSGVRWLKTEPGRIAKMNEAAQFFKYLWGCDIPMICIENPIPHKYADLPPYTQIIHPYQHAHGETKATCLWLKGLLPLIPRRNMKGRAHRILEMSPGNDRSKLRSETYFGIARSMAEQWG